MQSTANTKENPLETQILASRGWSAWWYRTFWKV